MARFMWGWVLLGLGAAAMVVSLLLLLGWMLNSLIPLFGAILYSGLGAWMVWSGARGSKSQRSVSQRGQMAKFTGGWVLIVLGIAAVVSSLLFLRLSAAVPGSSVLLTPGHVLLPLGATLGAALGGRMVWAARSAHRIRHAMWALGPVTSAAVAAGWLSSLAVWFSLAFGVMASSPECRRLGFLVAGSLFGAPLVGAIVVLVEWLRRRQASPAAGDPDTGVGVTPR
jgi:hypothetical protein